MSEGGAETNTPTAAPGRLTSVDAYRGFVMFLMMAEVLDLAKVAKKVPDSGFWAFLAYHQTHVEWVGCSLHDLIQPSFSFLVGVALPFSLTSRRAKGQSTLRMTLHAFVRALILILLGIFLRSRQGFTNYTMEDTLTQIGLGYGFLFLLALRPRRDQWIALAVILVGYWLAFAVYPLPADDFDYGKVDVPDKWLREHGLAGFAAHWNKNTNIAADFDVWFLNLFPRPEPFKSNPGGYLTLSFIPTLGTMLLGLLAGGVLRDDRPAWSKVKWLAIAGVVSLLLGAVLGWTGVCPIVKRIWTPSWTLYSGGWCFLILAALYAVMDFKLWRVWAYPFVVIGANSIAAYWIAEELRGFVMYSLTTHLFKSIFTVFGPECRPFVLGAAVLLVYWLILFWMYRRKIFLRI